MFEIECKKVCLSSDTIRSLAVASDLKPLLTFSGFFWWVTKSNGDNFYVEGIYGTALANNSQRSNPILAHLRIII